MRTLQQLAEELDARDQRPTTLLTDEQVRLIRAAPQAECHGDIAERVGCNKDQVSRVRKRATYRWVLDKEEEERRAALIERDRQIGLGKFPSK